MDEPNDAEETEPAPTAKGSPPKARLKWDSSLGCLAIPIIGWSALCAYGLWALMPLYFAIPLGIIVGFVCCLLASAAFASDWDITTVAVQGSIGLVLVLILFPVFIQAREKARRNICLENLGALAVALRQYANDNDEILPPAKSWADAIAPYAPAHRRVPVGVIVVFECPSTKPRFGYAFDAQLSSIKTSAVKSPQAAAMIYDSTTGTRNASDALTSLPKPGRHNKGNIVGYADGHARWVKDGETP